MAKLAQQQAETLLKIVEFANRNGGRLPTGIEFAPQLGVGERGASARVRRIVERADFVIKDGRTRRINYDQLCTEKESAKLLLMVHEAGLKAHYGRVTKSDISAFMGYNSHHECDNFVKKCCAAGYLLEIPANPGVVRTGPKTFDQLEYLKKLAEQ